jgi:hypothetical protein
MTALPPAQLWNKERISHRLNYLVHSARRADATQISKAHAFTLAAELTFAMGKWTAFQEGTGSPVEMGLREGIGFLSDAFSNYVTAPEDERPPTPIALLGAILGQAKVFLTVDALKIMIVRGENQGKQMDFPWSAPTPMLAGGIGSLLAAAAATNSDEQEMHRAFEILTSELPSREHIDVRISTAEDEREGRERERARRETQWRRRRLMLLAANSPETNILGAFGFHREHDFGYSPISNAMFKLRREADLDTAWSALAAREERYAAQIRLSSQDDEWPFGFQPKAPILDWTLLCWELAVLKQDVSPSKANDPSVLFIRDLAHEIKNSLVQIAH